MARGATSDLDASFRAVGDLDASRRRRLGQLRARLVAASLRSRSLRLTRATSSGALDLERLRETDAAAFERALAMLGSEGAAEVALCDVEPARDERAFTRDVAALAHAAEAAWAETGTRDLAVGWPFLEGRARDGTWIRAPLFLYPVKLAMTSRGRLTWALSSLGLPELNESLTRALVRLASVRITIDGLLAHDDDGRFRCDAPTWEGIANYLRSVRIELDESSAGAIPVFERLEPRLREDRARPPEGVFALRSHVVLGRFPRSDSSVVADYDELLAAPSLALDENLGVAARLLEVDDAEPIAAPRAEPNEAARQVEPTSAQSVVWRVFPSDDSQDEALRHANAGAVVVQGPPGTGKSQMIANLLASAVAEGKRVLVVCQKRAALDVVAERLASVGLREPLATVYDVQLDRREVCESITRTLSELGGTDAGSSLDTIARSIEQHSREHSRALGRLVARLETAQRAFATLHGDGSTPGLARLLERASGDDGRALPDLGAFAADVTEDAAHALVPKIELLARETVALAEPHPLARRSNWSGRTEDDLAGVFVRIRRLLDRLRALDELAVAGRDGLTPSAAAELSELWERASVLLDPLEQNDDDELRAFLLGWVWTGGHIAHGEWRRVMERLTCARKELEEAQPELVLERRARLEAWIADLSKLEELEGLVYRFFLPSWWALRKRPLEVLACCKGLMSLATGTSEARSLAKAARTLCERAIPWQELIDALPVDSSFFDFGLRGAPGDLDIAIGALEKHHAQTRAVHELTEGLRGMNQDFARVPDLGGESPKTVRVHPFFAAALAERRRARLYVEIESAVRSLENDFSKAFLDALLDDVANGRVVEARSLVEELAAAEPCAAEAVRLDTLTSALPAWARAFLRGFRPHEEGAKVLSTGESVLLALDRAWIRLARAGRSTAQIEAPLVEPDLLEQLSKEIDACLEAAGRGVLACYRKRVRDAMIDGQRGLSLRKLAADVAKRRNRATIRQLVERYWDQGLSSVRPIWFCSPESVAALFPLRADLFDIVVLDEASQCPVEAALPTFARARCALVAGDDQQMPPTHFFRASGDDEELEEDGRESTALATSSILGLSRVAFPGTVLRWHYRSRHEELVAFSNAAFYGRRLVTAPPADARLRTRGEGLSWVKVSGVWRDQTNEIEAERVVDIVAELLLEDADAPPSVGVIAFNKKQADLINDRLDLRMSRDDAFRRARERDRARRVVDQLFVRNLENVQGDERDVVVLSLAYGPTEAGGRVHMRFGPLGLEGGEKRLNVAITRARRGLVVVTSISPEDLDVSGSKHVGPKLLRAYLEFVRAHVDGRSDEVERLLAYAAELGGGRGIVGGLHKGTSNARAYERIGLELAATLEARGLRVRCGLGLGHEKLDLAVGLPGETRWRLGVDFAGFLSERDALRRDVYSPRFWRRLGWRVLRVSPGMWLEDREGVVERIVQAAGIAEGSEP